MNSHSLRSFTGPKAIQSTIAPSDRSIKLPTSPPATSAKHALKAARSSISVRHASHASTAGTESQCRDITSEPGSGTSSPKKIPVLYFTAKHVHETAQTGVVSVSRAHSLLAKSSTSTATNTPTPTSHGRTRQGLRSVSMPISELRPYSHGASGVSRHRLLR